MPELKYLIFPVSYIGYMELVTSLSTTHSLTSRWHPGHSSSIPTLISAPQCVHAVHDEMSDFSAIGIIQTHYLMIYNHRQDFSRGRLIPGYGKCFKLERPHEYLL